MNKKNYSYIGIAFVILLFGIYSIPKIVNRFQDSGLVKFNKVPAFEFTNQEGKLISNDFYQGKVYVVAVSYTHLTLPTICSV